MALGAVTIQLSDSLEFLVTKRQNHLDYLKRAHQGKCHWLNTLKLSKSSILKYLPQDKILKRSRRWLMLGVSGGRLLEHSSGAEIVRGLLQLFEEYDHYLTHDKEREKLFNNNQFINNKQLIPILPYLGPGSGVGGYASIGIGGSGDGGGGGGGIIGATPQWNYISTTSINPSNAALPYIPPIQLMQSALLSTSSISSSSIGSGGNGGGGEEGNGGADTSAPIKVSLQKQGKQVIYSVLVTPGASLYSDYCNNFDYLEIVYSLCDVFSLLYSKFLDDSVQNTTPLHDAAIKVDKKIKSTIIAKLSADLTSVATPLLKLEMKSLLNHLFVDESKSNNNSKRYYQLAEENTNGGKNNSIVDADSEEDDDEGEDD